MIKNLFIAIVAVLLCSGSWVQAQTFSAWGQTPTGSDYDTISFTGDTLRFQFTGCPAGAFGTGKIAVYFEGDISDNTELLDVNFAGASSLSNGPYEFLGTAGPNSTQTNCAPEDSTLFTFSVDTINAYAPDLAVIVIPSNGVGLFCQRNRVRVRLEYNYCTFGIPVEFASIILTDSVFCSTDAPLLLSGSPSGGVYSGIGTADSTFDPSGLSPGVYSITYTAADSIGCVSSASASVLIENTPVIDDTTICVGLSVTLTGGNNSLIWYSDEALTDPLDTGATYTTPALYQNTTYYAAYSCNSYYFRMDTVLADSINIVNNNGLVGDDRGGIAVTPQYVYYIADQGGVRYDADMQNPLSPLPTRDGLFSDLATGELFSLWNNTSNTEPQSNSTNYTVNAIRTLNADLSFGSGITELSQPVSLGNSDYFRNGIFAGAGILGLYSGNTQHFYVINICNGGVTDLGLNTDPAFRGTESWSDWGVIEHDGTGYSIIYRNNTGNDIVRLNLPAGTTESIGTFPAGIADLACLTYSPWNKNWYFHFEGTSGALGGTSESTGYANASDSMSVISGSSVSCPGEVVITVSNANLGPDTTICEQNYLITTGLGYSNYTWNGVNNNLNSYLATQTDTVIFEGLFQDGCNHLDTLIVNMLSNPSVNLGTDISACGAATLDAANPGSSYLWSNAATTQTISATSSGTYMVTVTNPSGCSSTDDISVTVNSLPAVTLALNPSLVCINWTPFLLTGGTPAGGTWSGTGVSAGSFIPSFAGLGSFTITYSYTDSAGCTDTASQSITVDACAGINEASGNGGITISPNPGYGVFMITAADMGTGIAAMEVCDMEGRTVYMSEVMILNGKATRLDLSELSEGIYIVRISVNGNEKMVRLAIVR